MFCSRGIHVEMWPVGGPFEHLPEHPSPSTSSRSADSQILRSICKRECERSELMQLPGNRSFVALSDIWNRQVVECLHSDSMSRLELSRANSHAVIRARPRFSAGNQN